MIKWNEYTWYSKLAAVIFFIGVLPIWTFYLGTQYERTVEVQDFVNIVDVRPGVTPTPIVTHVPLPTVTVTPKPIPTTPIVVTSGITGTVTIGPTCPVQRMPPDPGCNDKAYSTVLNLTTLSGTLVKKINVDAAGKFTVKVPPGQYKITQAVSTMYPRLMDIQPITVTASSFTPINIQFDSGIR